MIRGTLITEDAYEKIKNEVIGKTVEEASVNRTIRPVVINGVRSLYTQDIVPGRVNVEITDRVITKIMWIG